jgi:hypothetical protein
VSLAVAVVGVAVRFLELLAVDHLEMLLLPMGYLLHW